MTPRLTERPIRLLRRAAGNPAEIGEKARRLGRALKAYAGRGEIDERLRCLHERGLVDTIPTRVQLVVGAIDMLRFWIVPSSGEYYTHRGIDFTFHQVLRFLDDPASLVDPVGLLSERDVIIGHLMQVVHGNPRYDLELLEAYDRGLEALIEQVEAMIAGVHPRATSISAIIEDRDYHARLLEYVRAYLRDPSASAPLRENVVASAHFTAVERTFGSLRTAMRYFTRLPTTALGGALHLLTVRAFPSWLGEGAAARSSCREIS